MVYSFKRKLSNEVINLSNLGYLWQAYTSNKLHYDAIHDFNVVHLVLLCIQIKAALICSVFAILIAIAQITTAALGLQGDKYWVAWSHFKPDLNIMVAPSKPGLDID